MPDQPRAGDGVLAEDGHDYTSDPDPTGAMFPATRQRRLSKHVPIRFTPETIARVQVLADADYLTVSTWIRRAVEQEVERRGQ